VKKGAKRDNFVGESLEMNLIPEWTEMPVVRAKRLLLKGL
jgi:hypothetical protein